MRLILAIVFLCGIAGGCTIEPYWHDGACVADDAKIRWHYQADITGICPSVHGNFDCVVRHCKERSADIFITNLVNADMTCVKNHGWQHAKGKDHADGATDCAPSS